ncbi:hypothetical protein C1646_822450 [Rhizophagus diaphanus]|nr:hypothetical protein C1646_822450 [Rhizophagus diaphanus] [Rhizophagus sp. MUCL 43196]
MDGPAKKISQCFSLGEENFALPFPLEEGNTSVNAFEVDIEKYKSISKLKEAIKEKIDVPANFKTKDLKVWKVKIPDDQDDLLSNLTLNDGDELLATRDIEEYWPTTPPKKHIHVIVKLPLLSLEEALSCIPPPITYSPDCVTSKTTTKASGDLPTSVLLWGDFFDKVNQFRFDQQPIFERPRFNDEFNDVVDEEDVRNAIKAKRKHVLEDMGEETFPEFYYTSKGGDVIQQIYNYMGGNELRYGILTTYDNHWFLRREHAKLWISKTLLLESESPPAKENPKSPKPQVVVPVQGDNNSRTLRSHSKSSSNSSLNQHSTSSTSANQQPSSITSINQQDYNFTDFKFKGILGEGRSGKTLLCEFRGDTIALKSVDISKAPSIA